MIVMRLIDAKRLEANIKEAFRENPVVMGIMLRWIRKQPTAADVAPVVHGRWIMSSDRPDTIICGCCREAFDVWKADINRHHYCPYCGAKMDGNDGG